MTFDGGDAPRFAVGPVIATGLAVVSRDFFRLCGIVLAVGIPAVLLILLAGSMLASRAQGRGLGGSFQFSSHGDVVAFVAILGVLSTVAYLLIQGAVTYGTLQTLRGQDAGGAAGVGACLGQAFAALPRLFLAALVLFLVGLVIAMAAGMMVGPLIRDNLAAGGGAAVNPAPVIAISLLSLAATLAILVLIWVFVPAIVVERAGPIACFARSLALTKGRRWTVFGIVLVVFVGNFIATAITKLLMQSGAPLGGAVLNLLVAGFFMVLSGVLSTIGYVRLRAEKEGFAVDDVGRVFD